MLQRNLAVELLQKLLKGEIRTRGKRNVVQAAPSRSCSSRRYDARRNEYIIRARSMCSRQGYFHPFRPGGKAPAPFVTDLFVCSAG
jgi:hypothetical protein